MSESDSSKIARILEFLGESYGRLEWWNGTPEEVMIGAILTHQTRWENVKRAIDALKAAHMCSMDAIDRAPPERIESLIRHTGFFRVKAKRLKALAACVREAGGVEAMSTLPTEALRRSLLGVKGIGEETADSILCYAFSRPSFVIDAYTLRICACAGVSSGGRELRSLFEGAVPRSAEEYGQAHARIVEFAKERCVNRACEGCTIRSLSG